MIRLSAAFLTSALLGLSTPLFAGVTIAYESEMTGGPDAGQAPGNANPEGSAFKSVVKYRYTPMKSRMESSANLYAGGNPMLAADPNNPLMTAMYKMGQSISLTRLDQESDYSSTGGEKFKKTTFSELSQAQQKISQLDPAFLSHYKARERTDHKTILGCKTVGYNVTTDQLKGTSWLCRAKKWDEAAQFIKNDATARAKYAKDSIAANLAAEAKKIPSGVPFEIDTKIYGVRGGKKTEAMTMHMVATSIKQEKYDDSIFEPVLPKGTTSAKEDMSPQNLFKMTTEQGAADGKPAPKKEPAPMTIKRPIPSLIQVPHRSRSRAPLVAKVPPPLNPLVHRETRRRATPMTRSSRLPRTLSRAE